VLLSALLFAALIRGGIFVDAFSVHSSKDIVEIIQGVIIIFVAARAVFPWLTEKVRVLRRARA
jgi:ABC-type uncharacterized transport system permease subunit